MPLLRITMSSSAKIAKKRKIFESTHMANERTMSGSWMPGGMYLMIRELIVMIMVMCESTKSSRMAKICRKL